MYDLSKNKKQELLDIFGKLLIEDVRDSSLVISTGIVEQTTVNKVDLERYSIFSTLKTEQKKAVCELLSETITDVIYNFLDMFEANDEIVKLVLINDGKEYDMVYVSEKMGGEIARHDDEGWIQKFSEMKRFV